MDELETAQPGRHPNPTARASELYAAPDPSERDEIVLRVHNEGHAGGRLVNGPVRRSAGVQVNCI